MIEVFECGEVNYDPKYWPVTSHWEIDIDVVEREPISEQWLARLNGWA